MDEKYLITLAEFQALARPSSVHLDEQEVNAFIREVQDGFIIPAIGYELFKKLAGSELTTEQGIMLNGGEWTDESKKVLHYCKGLKATIAYFVYAKMMRSDGTLLARAGSMRHEDQYASHLDDTKLKQYNDVMGVAENYLSNIMEYINYLNNDNLQPVRGSRCHIHAIGE